MNTSLTDERLCTGVEGLDVILCGGLLRGSVYIVQGDPGGGKTILANQICFRQAKEGRRSVYFTLLSESHDRLLKHLQSMSFFDEKDVPESIYYESVFDIFLNGGLDGILKLIGSENATRDADLFVLDGLFVIEEKVPQEPEFRRFINELANMAHVMGATIILLTNSKRSSGCSEFTMVDGWIELGYNQLDYRMVRHLQVHKTRGSDFISGRHMVAINSTGIQVYPRLESVTPLAWPQRDRTKLSIGLPALDEKLGGGLESGASGVMLGPTGIGKTTMGLHYLSLCTEREPGLIFSFYEDQSDLVEKAQRIGLDLQTLIDRGYVEVLWNPPVETTLDELGARLLSAVRRLGAKRVFVDGVEAFRQSAVYTSRIGRFLTALTGLLRAEGATTLFSLEVEELIGGELSVRFGPVSAVAEYVIMLRYVELLSQIRRTLTIMKARNSAFDSKIREFVITDKGIRLEGIFQSAEKLLTGHGELSSRDV